MKIKAHANPLDTSELRLRFAKRLEAECEDFFQVSQVEMAIANVVDWYNKHPNNDNLKLTINSLNDTYPRFFLQLLVKYGTDGSQVFTLQFEIELEDVAVYQYCPICMAKGVKRERRPDGNDTCENGHTYPSRDRLMCITEPKAHKPKDAVKTEPNLNFEALKSFADTLRDKLNTLNHKVSVLKGEGPSMAMATLPFSTIDEVGSYIVSLDKQITEKQAELDAFESDELKPELKSSVLSIMEKWHD